MSDKKLLTESEIRRFMTLANIPALGKQDTLNEMVGSRTLSPGESQSVPERQGTVHAELGSLAKSEAMEPEMKDEGYMEEEAEEAGEEGEKAAGGMEELVHAMLSALAAEAKKHGVDVEVESGEGEEAGEEEMPDLEDAGEEAGEEEEEEEAGEEEELDEAKHEEEELDEAKKEEEEEETDEAKKLDESKLVDAVLARVTARLLEEAKKAKAKKAEKGGKKVDMKKKMAALRSKKASDKKGDKKLDEANAKSPVVSKPIADAPKAAGKADKGSFGVTSKVTDKAWKEGSEGKGSEEMHKVAASKDHTVSHGKDNLATHGGHKKVK